MKTIKNFIVIALVIALAFSTTACVSEKGNSKEQSSPTETKITSQYGFDLSKYASLDWPQKTITGAAMTDQNGSIGAQMRFYFDLIGEASQGKITFKEYWQGQLCSGPDTFENVQSGIADYGEVPMNYEYTPFILYQISFSAPFCGPDFSMTTNVLKKLMTLFPEYEAQNTKNNVHISAIRGEEDYQCPTTDKLDPNAFSLDWYKGAKLALGSSYFSRWCEAIGAVPVTGLGAPACYEAFQTGVINGVFGYNTMMYDWQYAEVCKSMIEQNIGACGGVLSMWNLDTWNSFSPEIQTALDELADLAVEKFNSWRQEKVDNAVQKLYGEDNLAHIVLTKEQKTEWAEKIMTNDNYNTIKYWINDAKDAGYDNAEDIFKAYIGVYKELGYEFPYDPLAYM